MTVNNNNFYVTYQVNPAIKTYPIPFKFAANSDIEVTIFDNLGNANILPNTAYDITGSGFDLAANLSLRIVLDAKQTIQIKRRTALVQTTMLKNYDLINGQVLEQELDRHVLMLQEMSASSYRCIQVEESAKPPILNNPKGHKGQLLIISPDEKSIGYYDASSVNTVGLYHKNNFSGDGIKTNFVLSFIAASANSVLVVVNKQILEPIADYNISSDILSFKLAPPQGFNNIYIINLAETQIVNKVGDNTIGADQLIQGMVLPNPELKQFSLTTKNISSNAGQLIIDLSKASVFIWNVSENTVVNFINPPPIGKNIGFKLFLTTPNINYKITWPPEVKFSFGFLPTIQANQSHLLQFETFNAGSSWYGAIIMQAVK